MRIIYMQALGVIVFIVITFVLGKILRIHPTKRMAEFTSRIGHFTLLFVFLGTNVTGFVDMEITHFDELLSISPLPFSMVFWILGALMMLVGLCLLCISVLVLFDSGDGLPAFSLSKQLAARYIYGYTRNPMAFGFSLIFIAGGLLTSSTFFTLWSISAIAPALIFYLKYFEEFELEIRFGQSYREYKQKVPFLIPRFRNFRRISGVV